MRLYIAGPMSGITEYNFPAFDTAARDLRHARYNPVNPADLGVSEGQPWESYVREGLRLLLNVQGVATLPGWRASRGACLEVHVATQLKLPVRPLHEWLALAERRAS